MSKTLKENVKQYIDDLYDEIEQLKNRNDDYAEVKTESLSKVVDWLETLLDAEQWREFRQEQKKNDLDDFKEKYYKLKNKAKEKDYLTQRSEEIISQYGMQKLLEKFYDLGRSGVYGAMLYMLESDKFEKNEIRKVIMSELKSYTQLRCDAYSVWSELKIKNEKE